ncbi:armadillo-type protein [Cristinia sonorae]|uniref:Armadillo-type protein n=1 Tax=Cristinia sonorae TaxID=1940300 RepID=A0A8K0UU67_9AGAR|nr:armadillo-type protein [Cristinia sonorae]
MNELVIEEDERTLVQIINHIFEKASKEDTSSNVWANLCRKMMEQIRPRNLEGEGKLVNGGQLFRRYLQNFCQERMEAIGGGSLHTTTMPIANTEFSSVPLQSVDRRGLIRLMGELFKVRMLPERVMHEVIKRLLRNLEDPEEEDVESLCQLLCAIGSLLDTPKARSFMEIYIHRVQKLAQNTKVHPRLRTMLRDVLDLRERKWVPASAPRPVPKAGDLSQFGKIQKTTSMKDLKSRESTISRTNSTNAFSILQNAEQISEPPVITSKPSRPASRKPSVDIGPGGVPEAPMQRRKLNLLPRTVKAEEAAKDSPAASIVNSEDDTPEAGPPMSEEEVKQRINEDSKEFFSIRDLYEADVYFIKLPVEHRHKLVDKLISVAIESKATDAELVANFFTRAASKNYCSPSTFEEGFAPISELLDDIVYDSPKAFSLYAMMMKGAGLDKDEERRARLASKLTDAEKLLGLLS